MFRDGSRKTAANAHEKLTKAVMTVPPAR
jgi:hypothetical protein